MATLIPRAQIPQSQINNIPDVRSAPTPDMRPLVEGAQIVNRAVQNILGQIQERNDTTALLQARRELSDFENATFDPNNAEGIAKYRGGNALGAGELVTKADTRIGEIRSRLNPRQAAQFDAISLNFRDQMAGRINNYMDREHSQFLAAEQKAAIDNLGNDAVTAGLSGDFARQDQVATELLAMDRRRLEVDGAGPEVIRASQMGIASNIRAQTALGMAATKPFEAQAYYQRYADQMTAMDRLKVEETLQPVVDDAAAEADADAIRLGGTPPQYRDPGQRGRAPTTEIQKILNEEADAAGVPREYLYALAEQESSFNPNAVNPEVLDDGDQATGLFQYRATSAGGIDRKDARASARRAAQEFARRRRVGGDEFAVAAHFAGEGGAEAVIQRGRAEQNPKTARYVSEVMGRAQRWREAGKDVTAAAVASTGPSPQGVPRTEADALAYADQTIADPRRRKLVKAKLRESFAIADAQKAEREKAISQNAYTALTANTDPRASLPQIIGPEAYALFASKGQIDSLMNYRKNVLTGTLVQDNPILADTLEREAVLSPNTFKKRNLYANANELSTDTLQRLLKMQAEVDKPGKQTEWATTNERIDLGLMRLGLDESQDPKGGSKQRQQQRAAFSQQYRAAETDFVQRNKRQPSPAEADTILRNITQAAALRLQAGTLTPDRLGNSFVTSITPATRAQIVADFREDLNREPTEAEIIAAAATYAQRGSQ